MLYIGNFSYNDTTDSKNNFCLMPCVVAAADSEEAMGKFADYLNTVKRTGDLLEGAAEIYLDSLVELEDAPEEPVITQWTKVVPAESGLCSIVSTLPDPTAAVDDVDDWVDQDEGDEPDDADDLLDDLYDEEPFVTF